MFCGCWCCYLLSLLSLVRTQHDKKSAEMRSICLSFTSKRWSHVSQLNTFGPNFRTVLSTFPFQPLLDTYFSKLTFVILSSVRLLFWRTFVLFSSQMRDFHLIFQKILEGVDFVRYKSFPSTYDYSFFFFVLVCFPFCFVLVIFSLHLFSITLLFCMFIHSFLD